MPFEIDESMHWTDHYVEHGFAVIRDAVPQAFCDRAIRAIQRELQTDLPPEQWNTHTIDRERVHKARNNVTQSPEMRAAMEAAYDEPAYRALVDEMFAPNHHWHGNRHAHCFISLQDPEADRSQPHVSEWGHIDFVECYVPRFGDGMTSQISLVKTEPFSGNITIYPGLHKVIQKLLLDKPDWQFGKQGDDDWQARTPKVEPFEFVANPGDVLFFHHLVGHAGNGNLSATGMPRVAIHCQVNGNEWISGIDPDAKPLSPWQRSHALNGPIDLGYDDKEATLASQREKAAKRAG